MSLDLAVRQKVSNCSYMAGFEKSGHNYVVLKSLSLDLMAHFIILSLQYHSYSYGTHMSLSNQPLSYLCSIDYWQ